MLCKFPWVRFLRILQNFEMLLSLAKLDSRTVNTSPVEEEALKLIANALMHHKVRLSFSLSLAATTDNMRI
jgi:hypothetical protein